jgi:hypothetical protein
MWSYIPRYGVGTVATLPLLRGSGTGRSKKLLTTSRDDYFPVSGHLVTLFAQ